MQEPSSDAYSYFGTYSNHDARQLLDAFESEGVRFSLDVNGRGIERMSAFVAANGGTCGTGVGIAVSVCEADWEKATAIQQRVLKIVV